VGLVASNAVKAGDRRVLNPNGVTTMQTISRHAFTTAFLGACVALGVAACSSANSPTSPTPALSQAQADTLGADLANEADAMVEGATFSSTSGAVINPAPTLGGSANPTFSPQCKPTLSPLPPTNSDSDAVPDSVRIDFSGCVISRPLATITLDGTVDIIDPTPDVTDHSVKTVYTNFSRSVQRLVSGKTWSLLENGIRMVSGSSSELQRTETGFHTEFTYGDGSTATHDRTWNSIFTADQAGTIKVDSLPSGTVSITGTSTWARNQNSWNLSVTTQPNLHYNADCTDAPRFDAGTLTAVATRNGASTTVTIQYTACGQYTVTRS
jgi:hypothetical protein